MAAITTTTIKSRAQVKGEQKGAILRLSTKSTQTYIHSVYGYTQAQQEAYERWQQQMNEQS